MLADGAATAVGANAATAAVPPSVSPTAEAGLMSSFWLPLLFCMAFAAFIQPFGDRLGCNDPRLSGSHPFLLLLARFAGGGSLRDLCEGVVDHGDNFVGQHLVACRCGMERVLSP